MVGPQNRDCSTKGCLGTQRQDNTSGLQPQDREGEKNHGNETGDGLEVVAVLVSVKAGQVKAKVAVCHKG